MLRITISFLVLSLILISYISDSAQVVTPTHLPKGKWTFKAAPYSGEDWKSIPVDVHSVTSNMKLGGLVEKVELRNRSDKAVTSVKLKWLLTADKRSSLADGETRWLTTSIPPGKTIELPHQVVEFSKIVRPFSKDGRLTGNFRIEVVVSEIEFEDGVTWKIGDPGIEPVSTLDDGGACANQGCLWSELGSYICNTEVGTFCAVENNGKSCTVTRCDLIIQ